MENGRVKTQGSVDKLIQENALEDDVVKSVLNSTNPSSTNLAGLSKDKKEEPTPQHLNAVSNLLAAVATRGDKLTEDIPRPDDPTDKDKKTKGKLIEEETKSEGAVSAEVYKAYLKFFGSTTIYVCLTLTFIFGQGIYILQSWWLRNWSLSEETRSNAFILAASNIASKFAFSNIAKTANSIQWFKPVVSTPISAYVVSEEHTPLFYISVYALIGVCFAVVSSLRFLGFVYGGLGASRQIFTVLLDKMMGAKLRFFDATPVGRIMNRFSKDLESVDQELAPFANGFIITTLACLVTIGVICAITPAFILFTIIIAIVYSLVETLVGVTTIRAYGDERRFLVQNLSKIDDNNRPFFFVWVNNRWLAFRTDMIGSFIVFLASALAVGYAAKIDSGLAGISLSFAVSFNQNAIWVLRMYANVEINMNSVERIQEYIKDTEQEPPAEIPENEPAPSWPQKGAIEVKDLSLRYASNLPRVIDNISFNVKPSEKIGVVGRTGAGKSTIITSFFRFVDPDSGYIKIDDVDITSIGLRRLRKSLTIIPQDPTLFNEST
ncbi:unnamed protein product [Ambrosiozyma monospora]|uniref:Unnamed protein product n=1 Tax=Ambrosiozyma monospora TaxID=43982 RepID=A0A9W6SW16_AMBMO|nr:unnamed protein product [Ambrosiozyma monospora]